MVLSCICVPQKPPARMFNVTQLLVSAAHSFQQHRLSVCEGLCIVPRTDTQQVQPRQLALDGEGDLLFHPSGSITQVLHCFCCVSTILGNAGITWLAICCKGAAVFMFYQPYSLQQQASAVCTAIEQSMRRRLDWYYAWWHCGSVVHTISMMTERQHCLIIWA